MPPLCKEFEGFRYSGDKVVVELDGIIFWGYVVGIEMYEDESLSYADTKSVINTWHFVEVSLQETLDPDEFLNAKYAGYIGDRFQFHESEVIPVTD